MTVKTPKERLITIRLNGATTTTAGGTTVQQLLEERGVEHRMIAVEYNAEILPKYDYEDTVLRDGDQLEVVHMVGGGA